MCPQLSEENYVSSTNCKFTSEVKSLSELSSSCHGYTVQTPLYWRIENELKHLYLTVQLISTLLTHFKGKRDFITIVLSLNPTSRRDSWN